MLADMFVKLAGGEGGLALLVLREHEQGGLVGSMLSRVIMRFTDFFSIFGY